MTLQNQLNKKAMNYLPKIQLLIQESSEFNSNQIKNRTLREILEAKKPLTDMSPKEINAFQNELINIFRIYGWVE